MRIALAGRPGSGKTSLLELIASLNASSSGAGPAERGGVRLAHVPVPDPRLDALSAAYRPRKTTSARLEFADLEQKAAPSYPALSAERKGMLAQADLILLTIDLFSSDPDDWSEVARVQWLLALEEFVLCDLATVETRLERVRKLVRIGQKPAFPSEVEVLTKLRDALEEGRPVRLVPLEPDEIRGLGGYSFLSQVPLLPAFNLDEGYLSGARERLQKIADGLSAGWVFYSAEVEGQIKELPPEEQAGFLEAFGLREPAVAQVIRAAYDLAGLHSFFTVGEDEVRAWSIRKGALAPEAAGVIHTDLERSFVRAEVLNYEDWLRYGTHAAAKEKGFVRLEGKEYVVRDGDILNIRSGLAKGRG
jgi:ribosome-binding ATPase